MNANPIDRVIAPVDAWQQRQPPLAFVVAVFVRYGEDRGSQYSALLSYYGFISLFPLLMVFVTVLGMVLHGNERLRDDILTTTFARIPIIGAQLRQSTESINGNGLALVIGIGVTLWAGLGVVQAAQDALNRQWGVPRLQRPGFFPRLIRGLGALAVVGVGIVAATAGTIVASNASDLGSAQQMLAAVAAIIVNIAVLGVSFEVLAKPSLGWRVLWPGAVLGGVALWAVQLIGSAYVTRVVLGASDVYGAFAIVFGLLVWIALLARIVLVANEVNVVRSQRLWPRSFRPREEPAVR